MTCGSTTLGSAMASPAVVDGVFTEFRVLKNGFARITIEVPVERANDALAALGGFPAPSEARWVAVAVLDPNAALPPSPPTRQVIPPPHKPVQVREPRRWREMKLAQQAGICASDPEFQAWAGVADESGAARFIRDRCGVGTRADLDTNPMAAEQWRALSRAFFSRHDADSQEASYRRDNG